MLLIYVLIYIDMFTFLLFEYLFVCFLRRQYQIVLKANGELLKTLEVRPPPKVRMRAGRSIVGL